MIIRSNLFWIDLKLKNCWKKYITWILFTKLWDTANIRNTISDSQGNYIRLLILNDNDKLWLLNFSYLYDIVNFFKPCVAKYWEIMYYQCLCDIKVATVIFIFIPSVCVMSFIGHCKPIQVVWQDYLFGCLFVTTRISLFMT